MSSAEIKLRRLTLADAVVYRDIRLEALRLAPEAFGSTFGVENSQPLSWFAARLENSAVFAAFSGDDITGTAAFRPNYGPKDSHRGVLVGMYVRAVARRRGIGRRLVEAVIEHARRHVEILELRVISGNETARHLYQCLGFVEYGIERNALKQDDHYWDEILMAKPLLPDEDTAS
jgi:ribosomal protein S18 acetylase RimI-like enzyme